MSYFYRLRSRIQQEGLLKTLHYGASVGYDTVSTFCRDTWLDYRYSGRTLTGNHKTAYKHLWANDIYHTDYSAMPLIFDQVSFTPQDVLVDVGCGKGRIINYWLSRKIPNTILGLELDPAVAAQTSRQFSRNNNVRIFPGDAIQNLPACGSVFYFYNPFEEPKVREFEAKLCDLFPQKSIQVIYYNPKSLHVFHPSRWAIRQINFDSDLGLKRWGRLNKYHDLAILCKKITF